MFSLTDLYITNSSGKIVDENEIDRNLTSDVVSWGQRSLALGIIEFLTLYWKPRKSIQNDLCVYIGPWVEAIAFISKLYPTFIFHLYITDMEKMASENQQRNCMQLNDDKVKIYSYHTFLGKKQDYKDKNVYFVSNLIEQKIHNSVQQLINKNANKKDINRIVSAYKDDLIHNMDTQSDFITKMNPIHAWVSFSIDTYIKNEKYTYLQGILYWKCWDDKNSEITWLKPIRDKKTKKYEKRHSWVREEYKSWCVYHNYVKRIQNDNYLNPFTEQSGAIYYPELLSDYDSHLETKIFTLNIQKNTNSPGPSLAGLDHMAQELVDILTWVLVHNKNVKPISKRRIVTSAIVDPFRNKTNVVEEIVEKEKEKHTSPESPHLHIDMDTSTKARERYRKQRKIMGKVGGIKI